MIPAARFLAMEMGREADEPAASLHRNPVLSKKVEPDFLSLSCPQPSTTVWMEIQVFYVRVSCLSLENAPEFLTIRCAAKVSGSSFEINRVRVSCAQEATLALRRDRMDTKSQEAIYVCTDRLRTTGSLPFKICHGEETLICGTIEKSDPWPDGQWLDGFGILCKAGWSMECKCALSSSGCAFMKRKGDSGVLEAPPSMEVCVAGRYSSSPVILTQIVHLVVRRRHSRRLTLDAIPEVDESERGRHGSVLTTLSSQMEEHTFYQELDLRSARSLAVYEPGVYLEGDDGELTWFNTGVRVGVGIGLGMCVGIGISVGLLMRGYQATTKALRRRLL